MINLELINSLNNHKKTVIPCPNKAAINDAQGQSVDYWMRHRKGKGWIIVVIDINTETTIFWEHSIGIYQHKRMGFAKPSSNFFQGLCSKELMFIVESDKWTPQFIHNTAEVTASQLENRIVVLEHMGDW